MQRRDFVKAIMAASVTAGAAYGQQAPTALAPPPTTPVAPGPVPWMRGLMEVKPLPITMLVPDAVAQADRKFFREGQMASLRRLGEVLQPAYNGYPGATEAGTPEFLDFLIGISPLDQQQMYQSGLDRLDAEANKHFAKTFAAVDSMEADQLLRPWLRTWMTDHPPTEAFEHFINVAHCDIRTATVNSQAWSEAARLAGEQTPNVDLYWYPVDPDLHREGAAISPRPISANAST